MITPFPISDTAMRLWREIERLDLAAHIAELEVKGFTVVPPRKVGPPDLIARMRDAALRVVEKRTDIAISPDMADDEASHALKFPFGLALNYVLFEDEVFQEALLNPVARVFYHYLLGENAILSDFALLVKGPGGVDLDLHTDSFRMPDPLPPMPCICNFMWVMTDSSRENGSIAFVPGSHRYQRRPLANEGVAERVHVDAPAGSLIVFGGNVWHGAYARTAPGYRAAATMYMCRPHMLPQGKYGFDVPQEVVDRHPPEFAQLMGRRINYLWKESGPDNAGEGLANGMIMGTHPWS